MNIPYSVE